MDAGSTPSLKHTKDYQSGALSFEIISYKQKLISNCGYHKKSNTKLNQLSKSSATQSTLVIDDNSSCKFTKATILSILCKKEFLPVMFNAKFSLA